MLNLGDKNVYQALRNNIICKLEQCSVTDLDILNRVLGTLDVLHALQHDFQNYVRLGDLILENKITYSMLKQPQAMSEIAKYTNQFGFQKDEEFLKWLEAKMPNPKGLAPCGYVRGGIGQKEKEALQGDKFDIHVHKGEFITEQEKQEKVTRLGAFGTMQGKPLPAWSDAIKQWSKDFIQAATIANECNMWQEFAYGLGNLPCGQGRFWPLEEFVINTKQKKSLSDKELDYLSEKLLSSPAPHTKIALSSSPKPVLSLDHFTDLTMKMTGKVPNKNGFCLIADYLAQKHKLPIYVAESVIDLEKLFDLMTNSQVKPGTKIAVLGMSTSGHWYSLQVEKTTTQQLVLAAMDSLGDGEHARSSAFLEISQAMNNFINTHQTYKSSELYYNRERMQFDPENCGTFSARFCKRMLKASNFVQGLKDKGNLIPFEGIDLEHADFIRLYSLPANCYFTQYPALGANKDTVLQKMNHQYQCTQQVKGNTIAERFDASELGGLNNNPYYHIYTSVVRLRDKYWQKAIEAYYKRYTPSQLEEILAKRKLANMSLQQLMQLQPDVKKAASSNSNKFDYRNYIAMCKNDGDSAVKPKP